jgi:hypothetical protein
MTPLYAVRGDARDNSSVSATPPVKAWRVRALLTQIDAYLPGTIEPTVDHHSSAVGGPKESKRQGVCTRRERGCKRHISTQDNQIVGLPRGNRQVVAWQRNALGDDGTLGVDEMDKDPPARLGHRRSNGEVHVDMHLLRIGTWLQACVGKEWGDAFALGAYADPYTLDA